MMFENTDQEFPDSPLLLRKLDIMQTKSSPQRSEKKITGQATMDTYYGAFFGVCVCVCVCTCVWRGGGQGTVLTDYLKGGGEVKRLLAL